MGRGCSTYGEIRYVYRVLMGEAERNSPLGGPRRRWEYNIKMELQVVDVNAWIGSIRIRTGTVGWHI
jgi:hypothetical protein